MVRLEVLGIGKTVNSGFDFFFFFPLNEQVFETCMNTWTPLRDLFNCLRDCTCTRGTHFDPEKVGPAKQVLDKQTGTCLPYACNYSL